MTLPTLDPVLVLAARAGIGLLLATAAVGKLRHSMYFRANLREYGLLPNALVACAAHSFRKSP